MFFPFPAMWGCPRGGFGRVESEFGVKNGEKQAPGVKTLEKLTFLICYSILKFIFVILIF